MNTKNINKNTDEKKIKKMFYEEIRDKYVNPFTDFGFKKLFGEECNKDLLLDFLNEILYEEQGRIVSLSYLNKENLGISEKHRSAFFDLYCENEKGEKFIVEMQRTQQEFFKDRTLYYSTFPILEQGKKNNWNFELKAVYTIAILDFVFEEDKHDPDKYRYDVKLTDIKTHKVFYDKLTFIYLEMPKFTKEVDELETRFEKWMYVIKNLNRLDDIPKKLRDRIFEKMFAAAEVAQLSKEEYWQYQECLKYERDFTNSLVTAEKKGERRGEKRGEKKGEAKGIAIGRAEEKIQTVIHSYQEGFKIEDIAKITRLTPEEITAIIIQEVV
jgi:predicted transposase/invertase (TIGR01784 family)